MYKVPTGTSTLVLNNMPPGTRIRDLKNYPLYVDDFEYLGFDSTKPYLHLMTDDNDVGQDGTRHDGKERRNSNRAKNNVSRARHHRKNLRQRNRRHHLI